MGATQGARATAISEMATAFKSDLSGPELALALGPATDLTDGNRANAVAALARATRFGPSIGGDAGPALNGATQGARATAISEMAPYFRTDMRGQDVAAILGTAQVLSDGNRANAIAALARAGRMPRNTTGAEAEMMLVGATQGARATSIVEMSRYFADGLSGADLVAILGPNGETTEGNRYNAIAALAHSRKIGTALSAAEIASVLQGTSGGTRNSANAEIVNPANQSLAQRGNSNATQSAPIAQTPAIATPTIASIDARIARLRSIESTRLPYLYESTGAWSDISIVARDLPVRLVGLTDYRALSDQLYFASIQYASLAGRWITKAKSAKVNGDLGAASRCLDHATNLLMQRQSTYDAAVAAANSDLVRATSYVRATYEASKWSAKAVATVVPGASVMVDAAGEFIDFALNVQGSGLKNATGQTVVDALTFAIIDYLPIADLGGRTLSKALENQTGKILADSGVIVAIHDGIKDARVRKVLIDGAKKLLALPIQGRIEDQINAALDRLGGVSPADF